MLTFSSSPPQKINSGPLCLINNAILTDIFVEQRDVPAQESQLQVIVRPVPFGPCTERLRHQIVAEAVELVVPLLQGAVMVVEIDGALDNLASVHMKFQIFFGHTPTVWVHCINLDSRM